MSIPGNEAYPWPPRPRNPEGELRRVGVELEFSNLDVSRCSRLIARVYDGKIRELSPYEHEVDTGELGVFRAEFDVSYLKSRGRERSAGQPEEFYEGVLRTLAEQVMPFEIVAPPLTVEQLPRLDELVSALREAGAKGTEAMFSAFGLHFNPEVPDLATRTVLDHFRAFLCLYPWLKARSRVDLTRRLTTFIDPFPERYTRKVLNPDYQPSLAEFIEDYLRDNPSRNRALDMLPLLSYLDGDRVRAQLKDERIKPRPTFHYRLPNCDIDRPGWQIDQAWRDWLTVERLAARPEALLALSRNYLAYLRDPLRNWFEDWSEETERWLTRTDL